MKSIRLLIATLFFSIFTYGQNIEWQYTYGGSLADVVTAIEPSINGGYLVCGYSKSKNGDVKKSFDGNDYWIFKINEDGVLQWEYKLGGSSDYDLAVDVTENQKGEIIVIGSSFSNDGQRKAKEVLGSDDLWIAALNKDGKLLWSRTYGGSLEDKPTKATKLSDGSIIVTGHTKSRDKNIKKSKGKQDIFALKFKKKGKLNWMYNYGGSKNEIGHSIKATSDGGFIIAGETESSDGDVVNKRDLHYDAWIVKLDKKGRIQWQKTIGGSKDDIAKDIIETPEGEFIFVGETESEDGHVDKNFGAYDCWIVKLNNNGRIKWQKTIGGLKVDFGHRIAYDFASGNYFILGSTTSSDPLIEERKGSSDLWLVSIDKDGKLLSNKALGGNNMDEPGDLLIDKKGNIIVAATTLSNDGNITELQRYESQDIWILKLVQENEFMEGDKLTEQGNALTKSYAGGYFLLGTNIEKSGNSNIILSQYDPAGFEMFKKEIDGNGSDVPTEVIKSHDGSGSYYVTGYSNSTNAYFKNNRGRKDAFLMKVTGTGDVIYVKTFGGSNDDIANSITKANKEEFIIAGSTRSTDKDIKHDHFGDKDIWVVNLTKTGKIKWEKNYGGFERETATKVIINNRRKVVLVGYSNSSDEDIETCYGNNDGIFMILGDTGKIEVQRNYGDAGNDWLNDVIQTSDGGYILAGATRSPKSEAGNNGGTDFWVIRTNAQGDPIWEKTYGGSNNEVARSVIKQSNGQYVIIGTSNSNNGNVGNAKGHHDGWAIRIDDNGKLLSEKSLGSSEKETIKQAIHLNGKKFVGIGTKTDANFNTTIWIEEFKN